MVTDSNEEISITPVLVVLKKTIQYLIKKWVIILLAAVIGSVLAFAYATSKRPTYTASLTFVLSSESRVSSFSSLASQLGFGNINTGGSDLFSGDNILTLFLSRNMIERTLFKMPPGGKDILLNIIVKELELDKEWAKQQRTKNAFPFPKTAVNLTGVQDSLVREVHSLIVGKYLSVGRPNKGLSYYNLSTTSTNEIVAFYFTRFLMDETAKFFIETKTKLAQQNLQMVQKEADSLRSLLSNNITATAASVERTYNLNPALQVQKAPIQRSQINTSFLTNAYNELAQNVIVAKLNLQKEIPLYQIIDEPSLPLKASYSNPIKYSIAGFFAFAFLTVIILLIIFFLKGRYK